MMKKYIILGLIIILPILIYLINIEHKIYYLGLGDSLALGQNPYHQPGEGYNDYVRTYLEQHNLLEFYSKDYAVSDYRIVDLIRDINDNKKIRCGGTVVTIKNALTRADLVTVMIGYNDLLYKLNPTLFETYERGTLTNYINEVMADYQELIILLKKYCKEDIIILNYYLPPWVINKEIVGAFNEVNYKLKGLAQKHQLYYLDLSELLNNNDYFPNPLDLHPGVDGYRLIGDKIIEIIEKEVL